MARFGISIADGLRSRLETVASARGKTLNGLISEILTAAVEDDPRSKLDSIREMAIRTANEAVEVELQAVRAVRETLQERIAEFKGALERNKNELDELRRRIVEDPTVLAGDVEAIRRRIADLEQEHEVLRGLLDEAQKALATANEDLQAIKQRWSQKFCERFEAEAWSLVKDGVNRAAEALAEAFALAYDILSTTRAVDALGLRIKLYRYLENCLWSSLLEASPNPDIVVYARQKVFGDAFRDWNRVCAFFREDFAPLLVACGLDPAEVVGLK